MPRLRKRGRVWYSDIYIGGRRVRRPLSSDKVVAEERLADLVKDREARRHGHARRDVPWPTFRDKYLEYSRGTKAPATAERDTIAIRSLERYARLERLDQVTVEVLERWKAARRTEGRGAATINRDLRAVKTMLYTARTWGYLRDFNGRAVKKLREARGRLLFYTVEELRRLLDVCRSRFSGYYDWETICLLGARAGLRRSEIYWLAWDDVDLERRVLQVTAKEGWQPKTGESGFVPIRQDLARHLRSLKRSGRWVIGERPSPAVMSAFFRKISRRAKLKGNIHTLRHTFASLLVQAGVDLYTVSKLLRHRNIQMTEIYAHLAPRTLSEAVERGESL